MRTFTVLFLIFMSLVSAHPRCGTGEAHAEYLARGTQALQRPVNQTFLISPLGHFHIHYDTLATAEVDNVPPAEDLNLDGIPDYVTMTAIMADSAWLVLTETMGFDIPPADEDGYYDVFLRDDLPTGWFGVTHSEGNGLSFIEIDNDFSEDYFSINGIPAMKVTMVHEFFHAIQFGYSGQVSGNLFFYEMSSTWFEDVVVPEVNDYLSLRAPFFLDPTQRITQTDGYSIALFGHYLTLYDNEPNELDSRIIRLIWEDFAFTSRNSFNAMNHVLHEEYNSSFAEAWTGFLASNLFNSIDESKYYYPDQALIGPISTSPGFLSTDFDDTVSLRENGATIVSLQMGSGPGGSTQRTIELINSHDLFEGKMATVGAFNSISELEDTVLSPVMVVNDKIHLIYCSEDTNEISIEVNSIFSAQPPTGLIGMPEKDGILLRWRPSPGPGDDIVYHIFRDEEFLITIPDTTYLDTEIIPSTEYHYMVTADNGIGESTPTAAAIVTSWPSEDSIKSNRIVDVYPNPFYRSSANRLELTIDARISYTNAHLDLVNLQGRRVYRITIPYLAQGRQRVAISDLHQIPIASGIYFAILNASGSNPEIKKILILN